MFTLAGHPKTVDTEFSIRIDDNGDLRLDANGVTLIYCDHTTGIFHLGYMLDVAAARLPEIKLRDYRIVIE